MRQILTYCSTMALAVSLAGPVSAVENGTYQIIAKHSNKCLDVSGVSVSNGAKVHQWRCHDGDNQKWQITDASNGATVKAIHSQKCLDVTGVSYEAGAMMQQWSCGNGANQRFQFVSQGNGYYQIQPMHSGMTVEIGASSQEDGANVKQWNWWGGDSQQFRLKKLSGGTSTSTELAEGTYQIKAKHSGKCMDVSGVSTSNGAKIHQWRCHDGHNQKWQVVKSQGNYQLKALHSGKCLDVTEVSYSNGMDMQQWSCGAGSNQHFALEKQSDGNYRIKPIHSGKTVQVSDYSRDDGAFFEQHDWEAKNNEVFSFTRVSSNPSNPTSTAVWGENFNSRSAGSQWMGLRYTEIRNNCGTNGSRCVRVTYNPSSEGSPRTVKNINLPAAKEYTLNYDVMFENGFEFVHGGKLPGLGPDNVTAGCNPIASSGWSARVMWRDGGMLEIYSYHQNRANRCGDDFHSSIQFAKGKYHAVSLHVKVNDPWSANGLIELYVDGRRVATHQNVQLRGTDGDHTLITRFLFHTFFGGSSWYWAPSKTVYSRFDNFAVYPGLRVRSSPGQ